ncbi:MAG: DUF5320 domain-containing protein [Promethearchaeota archaeon]
MPFGDRTGPAGLGPRTGRGLGYCNGYPHPGNAVPGGMGMGWGWGRGYGRGGGRGLGLGWRRGWGRGAGYWGYAPVQLGVVPPPPPAWGVVPPAGGYYPTATKEQVLENLNATKKAFEEQAKAVAREIERVEKDLREEPEA